MLNVFAPHEVFLLGLFIVSEYKSLFFLFYSHTLIHVVVSRESSPPNHSKTSQDKHAGQVFILRL